jgi:probable phosphoglycerate mutase
MAIYLIRHAETASNAARIVQTPDAPLSQRGCQQAERLAQRLARANIATILSSDLQRALMTAECIRGTTGARLLYDAGLQERNYGDIRGRRYDELHADIFAADYAPPGGETWEAFDARVDAVWERVQTLALRTPGNLAVVTHGLVCYSVARRLLQLPDAQEAPLRWCNTGVTIVEGVEPWRVQLLNCTAHLDAISADDPAGRAGR